MKISVDNPYVAFVGLYMAREGIFCDKAITRSAARRRSLYVARAGE